MEPMNNFIYENATKVYFGRGCVKEYLTCLLGPYGGTVLLVYGCGSIKRNGIYQQIMDILRQAGKAVVELPNITPNPTYRKVLEGAALARAHHVDMILAVGGGSVMDCAKAISLAAKYPGDWWQDFWVRPGVIDFDPLPVGVVATGMSCGGACNGRAIVTNGDQKQKTGRDYPKLNPRFALLDPAYTGSLSAHQVACAGFAALCHLMGAYFSRPNGENVSDTLVEALMAQLVRSLRAILADPQDDNARSNLMWAVCVAESRMVRLGKRWDWQCLTMANQLAAYTNCSHGEALAVLQPVYCRHIFPDAPGKFARFARQVWGLPPQLGEEALAKESLSALTALIQQLNLPTTLWGLGISEKGQLREIAASCGISAGGSHTISHREVLEMLKECYE